MWTDSMLSSYLLQATDHPGLQVQNSNGEWIDCPQVPGTFGWSSFHIQACSSNTRNSGGNGPRSRGYDWWRLCRDYASCSFSRCR